MLIIYFLMRHMISHFFFFFTISCDVGVKSQNSKQMHLLVGYCSYTVS